MRCDIFRGFHFFNIGCHLKINENNKNGNHKQKPHNRCYIQSKMYKLNKLCSVITTFVAWRLMMNDLNYYNLYEIRINCIFTMSWVATLKYF